MPICGVITELACTHDSLLAIIARLCWRHLASKLSPCNGCKQAVVRTTACKLRNDRANKSIRFARSLHGASDQVLDASSSGDNSTLVTGHCSAEQVMAHLTTAQFDRWTLCMKVPAGCSSLSLLSDPTRSRMRQWPVCAVGGAGSLILGGRALQP